MPNGDLSKQTSPSQGPAGRPSSNPAHLQRPGRGEPRERVPRSPAFCGSSNEDTCWPCSPACPRPGRSTVGCGLGPLPAQTACREARPGPVPVGKQSHGPAPPHQGGPQNARSLQSSTHGGQPAGQSRWPASARESPRIQTRALWAPELVLLTHPRNPCQRCSPCSPLSRGDKTAHGTHHGPSSGLLTAHGGWVNGPAEKLAAPHGQGSARPPTAETLAQSPAPGCSGAGAAGPDGTDGPDNVDGADSVDGPDAVDSPDGQPHPSPGSHSAHHAASPRQGTQPPVPPISLRPTAQTPRASPPACVHKPKQTHRVKT